MKADGGFEGKATSAGRADSSVVSDRAVRVENDRANMRFHWNGQNGQPSWLWGGNNPGDMYVYNPSNFTVSRANTAGTADNANNLQGKDLNFLYRHLGGRHTPTIRSIFKNLKDGGSLIHVHSDYGIRGLETGDIYLTEDYRNFDKIMIIGSSDNLSLQTSTIWEKWELEYMFNATHRFNLTRNHESWWYIWSAVKIGNIVHPLSTPTIWKTAEESTKIVDILGITY